MSTNTLVVRAVIYVIRDAAFQQDTEGENKFFSLSKLSSVITRELCSEEDVCLRIVKNFYQSSHPF